MRRNKRLIYRINRPPFLLRLKFLKRPFQLNYNHAITYLLLLLFLLLLTLILILIHNLQLTYI